MKALSYPRLAIGVGLVVLFISLFLEWYSYQVIDINNKVIASWSYNLFYEWTTEFPKGLPLNEKYRPLNLNVPLYITILFLVTIFLSVGVIFIRDISELTHSVNTQYVTYIFGFLLGLTFFYIVLFPGIYLFPNELYYPVVTYIDTELNTTMYYSVGLGYVLQLVGFALVFPYSIYSIFKTASLEKNRRLPEVQIETIIHNIQEPLDLDEFIAEEELQIKNGGGL